MRSIDCATMDATSVPVTRAAPKRCPYWPERGRNASICAKTHFQASAHFGARQDELRRFKFDMLAQGAVAVAEELYKPECPDCLPAKRCVQVRIDCQSFSMRKNQKRAFKNFIAHADVSLSEPRYTPEIYALYKDYLKERHGWGKTLPDMAFRDTFTSLLKAASVLYIAREKQSGKVVSVEFGETDGRGNFLSHINVYDTNFMKLAPGLSILLYAVHDFSAQHPHGKVYLGSWNPGPKLSHKSRLLGIEYFHGGEWHREPPSHAQHAAPACALSG